jgi:hypothetical protein
MFFRGRKVMIRAVVKAIGDVHTRNYRVSVSYDYTPGYIQNRCRFDWSIFGPKSFQVNYQIIELWTK